MPKVQFAVEMGMGTDLKGQDYTKAAAQAVHDAGTGAPRTSACERERARRGGFELDAAVARLPHDAADAGGRDESRG